MEAKPLNAVSNQEALELIRFAILAPSGHNTQPWKFTIEENTIKIYPDFSRRLPVVDADDHALFISLGCALENLLISAKHSGFTANVEYFLESETQDCIVVYLSRTSTIIESNPYLFDAIAKRQSTRSSYDGRKIPLTDLQKLEAASHQEGIQFRLFTNAEEIEQITDLVKQGNRQQFSDPAFVNELLSWIRFNKREEEFHRDGITAPVMGLPNIPRWLGKTIMKTLATPESQAKQFEKLIQSSAALMVFIAQKNNKKHWVDLGRSFQRVALTATTLNIKHAHLNMPCEVLEVRSQFQQYLKLPQAQPLLLLRLGYSKPMPNSPRRSVQEVLL